MFVQGSLAGVVACSHPPDSPKFARAQKNLRKGLSNPILGMEYVVRTVDDEHTTLAHLLDALRVLCLESVNVQIDPPETDLDSSSSCGPPVSDMRWNIVGMDVAKLQDDRAGGVESELEPSYYIEMTTPGALMYELLKLDIDDVAASVEASETLLSLCFHVEPVRTGIDFATENCSAQHPHPLISEVSSVSDTTVYESLGVETEMPKLVHNPVKYESKRTTPKASINLPAQPSSAVFVPIEYAPTMPNGIVGLNNLGNTCYLNSALQCLLQTPDLMQYFLSTVFDTPEEAVKAVWSRLYSTTPPTKLADAFADMDIVMKWGKELNPSNPLGSKGANVAITFGYLVKKVWTANVRAKRNRADEMKRAESSSSTLTDGLSSSSASSISAPISPASISPKQLKTSMGIFNESFIGYDQQDSQELLQVLLDALNEDLKPVPKSPSPLTVGGLNLSSDSAAMEESEAAAPLEQASTTNHPLSPIAKIFQGNLKSHIQCIECNKTSTKIDPYTLLSVPISNNTNGPCKPPRVTTIVTSNLLSMRGFIKLRIPVEYDWTVLDFKKHLADRLEYSAETKADVKSRLIVYMVDRSRIVRIFSDWELAMEVVADDEPDLDSCDGLVVAEVETKPDYVLVPLHYHCGKTMVGIPSWVNVPRYLEFEFKLPKLLDFCQRHEVDAAIFCQESNHLGKILYPQIVKFLVESGLTQFPLYRPKDSRIDVDTLVKCRDEDDDGKLLNQVAAKYLRHRPTDIPGMNLFPIPFLFNITLRQGSETATSDSEKEDFLLGGFKYGINREIYPSSRLPSILVEPWYNTELLGELEQVYDLKEEIASGESFLMKVGEIMREPEFPKRVYTYRGTLEGQALLLISFSEPLGSLLLGNSFVFRVGDSVHEPRSPVADSAMPVPLYTLENCLQEFLKEELMSTNDLWYCPECKAHKQIKKKLDLETTPEVLIFHLKRFSSSGGGSSAGGFRNSSSRKIEALVQFPLTGLDVSPYMSGPNDANNIYDLYAVSNHMGGLGGGHYTAFVKSIEDGNWYDMDDHRTRQIREENVVTSDAYLLFYKRRSGGRGGRGSDEEDGGNEKNREFWKTWEKLAKYGELIVDMKQTALNTVAFATAKALEDDAAAVLGSMSQRGGSTSHSRYVSSNASIHTVDINISSSSTSNGKAAVEQHDCDASLSKRAKLSADIDEVRSNQSSVSTSSAQSGVGSPIEHISVRMMDALPEEDRVVEIDPVIGITMDHVMSDVGYIDIGDGVMSPASSSGKRSRE
ncbi:UNVERIFIED_CONTAM: Ubiquitin carboxyl-terminal hydrolase 15 [Siphonaria sp. JEL0065]|nr:Ubiquitin carboxyl-terminal hydrolase 15 [Siphonaria sp. JEL0065]